MATERRHRAALFVWKRRSWPDGKDDALGIMDPRAALVQIMRSEPVQKANKGGEGWDGNGTDKNVTLRMNGAIAISIQMAWHS